MSVRLYGREDSFGTQPDLVEVLPVPDWLFEPGADLARCAIDPLTGRVILAGGSIKGNGDPTADHWPFNVFDPDTLDFSYEKVPTSTGFKTVNAVTFDGMCNPTVLCYGGGTSVDVAYWVGADEVPRWLLLNFHVLNAWQKSVYGIYPYLAAVRAATGLYDAAMSRVTDDTAAESPAAAAGFQLLATNACYGSEPYYGNKGMAEMSVFPNGHVVIGQYFPGGGVGGSGHVVILDDDLRFVASYDLPDFYYKDGAVPPDPAAQRIGVAVRSVQTCPFNTDPADLEFILDFDIFPPASRTITRAERTDNLVTFTTSVDHGFGVGMFVEPGGFTGGDVALNPNGFTGWHTPIVAATADTFTMRIAGTDFADHAVSGAATARCSPANPLMVMKYDATSGTITAKSSPTFWSVDQRGYGQGRYDNAGNLWLNTLGVALFGSGPAVCYQRNPSTGELSVVEDFPADELTMGTTTWGDVAEPAFRFGAVKLAAAAIGGLIEHDKAVDGFVFCKTRLVAMIPDSPLVAGENLQPDPSFETDDPAGLWTGFFSHAVWDAGLAHTGAKSMRVINDFGSLGNPLIESDRRFEVDPDQSYEVEAWVQPESDCSAYVAVRWYNAAGDVVAEYPGPSFQTPAGVWTRIYAYVYPAPTQDFSSDPDQAVEGALVVHAFDIPHLGWYDVDDVAVTKSPAHQLPALDIGITDLPQSGGVRGLLKGAVDWARRLLWIPVGLIFADQPCPPRSVDGWLYSLDLDDLFYPDRGYQPTIVAGSEQRRLAPVAAYTPDLYPSRPFGPVRADQ